MRNLTWTTEEKQDYLAKTLKRYYESLDSISNFGFVGTYTTQIDCNSKYELGVIFTATDCGSYLSYDLGLTLYKKENGVAQHSLRLALDNSKVFNQGQIYIGYSTSCFRGKLKTDQTVGFSRSYVEPKELLRLTREGIHKEELLSAYFDGATALTKFLNSVLIKAEHPHLKVEGLEDD
jgi:hypothetical protein